MAVPWLVLAVLAGSIASPFLLHKGPVPEPLRGMPQPTPVVLPAAYTAAGGHPLTLGDRVLLRTTQGDVTVVLFPDEAPTFTRHFLKTVAWGRLDNEGIGPNSPGRYVELGSPYTDVNTGALTFKYDLMPHAFDTNSLPELPGSLVMNRRFVPQGEGGFVRNEYALITGPGGYFPGVVIGYVVAGLDVASRLGTGQAILVAADVSTP